MSASSRSRGASIADWVLPLGIVVALIGLWEIAAQSGFMADVLDLDSFLVPAPSEIATSLWENRTLLAESAWVTFREVFFGFLAALVVGVLTAAMLHLSPLMRRAFYPLVVASQTIPILVVAPVLIVWLGFGIGPKVAIVALLCFFPITVNTLDGLATVDPEQRNLMRSLGAGRARTFALLEVPTALPYVLSGAKIAVAVAVIGAVFGEWSGGSDAGLGYLIQLDNGQLEVARLFASVVVLSAMAILLFAALALLERRLAWWGDAGRTSPTKETLR